MIIFSAHLAAAWPDRPEEAEYLGNPAFHRLFLAPHPLRPRLVVKGSGIDWFSVSAEWEAEGVKLTAADLQRLQTATGRFVKLPDAGWLQLDAAAVQAAHEALADLGVDGLVPVPQRLGLEQAAHLDEAGLRRFGDSPRGPGLAQASGGIQRHSRHASARQASTRNCAPTSESGFDFLCHLSRHKLGGILADDMGLGKTLQTLVWLAWLKANQPPQQAGAGHLSRVGRCTIGGAKPTGSPRPSRCWCWKAARPGTICAGKIPEHDLIVTNYALLRRDLEALQKFSFRVVILDEAQFIKNPDAQITHFGQTIAGRSASGPDRHAFGEPPAGPLEHR